jgi:hypothetical protein
MELPAVLQEVSLVVKSIELIEMQDALQRPTHRRQQLLVNRALPLQVYFQNGLVRVALD